MLKVIVWEFWPNATGKESLDAMCKTYRESSWYMARYTMRIERNVLSTLPGAKGKRVNRLTFTPRKGATRAPRTQVQSLNS